MTSVSNIHSVALHLLQQVNPQSASGAQKSAPDKLLAVANGGAEAGGTGQARAKVSEAIFSVNHVSVNEMKLDLIERTGKALGVDQADYASRDDFVKDMQEALGKLKMEGGDLAVIALEKELGLDKLGVSLQDVINGARDPEANDKLTKALERQSAEKGETNGGGAQVLPYQPDEIGLYGPSGY